MTDLSKVAIGTPIAISRSDITEIYPLQKILKNYVVINNMKFRFTGSLIGGSKWHSIIANVATQKDYDRVERLKLIRENYDMVCELRDKIRTSLTDEQLKELNKKLKEINQTIPFLDKETQ